MLQPNDLPLVCLPVDLSDEAAAKLVDFLHELTAALERRGPGPFQILYRTRSMDAAAKWMADHGLPPPARGIRNTGEEAMLVIPEHACGVYIGFVGPA
jgi:hypothetical protein